MNKDLIIGILVALGVHVLVLFGFNDRAETVQLKAAEVPVLEVIEMPVIEPDEPPPATVTGEQTENTPTYTPMLADVPTAVAMADFVQQLQPPPPPNAPAATGAITIPVSRTNVSSTIAGKIFNINELDQIPQATVQLPPKYPYEMQRQQVEGTVLLGFIVDSQGTVRDPYVVSSPQIEFNGPALQAILKWRFRPGRKSGKYVSTRMQLPMVFKLPR